MYCPSCGAESALDLNYCNRCGANMAVANVSRELVPTNLTWPALAIGLTIAAITLGGFAVLIGGATALAQVFHVPDPIMAVIMFGMTTILVSDIMLIRLLSRIIRSSLETNAQAKPKTKLETKKGSQPALSKPQGRDTPRQLSPQLEPVPSVTEHTTRTFTPIFREPSDGGDQIGLAEEAM